MAAAAEDFIDPDTGDTLNATTICLFWLNEAEVLEAARITTIQTTLNNRLTTAATVGDTALTTAVSAITEDTPEVAVVILADTGANPLTYPYLVGSSTKHSMLHQSPAEASLIGVLSALLPFPRLTPLPPIALLSLGLMHLLHEADIYLQYIPAVTCTSLTHIVLQKK